MVGETANGKRQMAEQRNRAAGQANVAKRPSEPLQKQKLITYIEITN